MKADLIQNLEDRSWDGIVLPVAKGALKDLALPEIGELEAVRRQCAFAGNRGELYQFTTLRDAELESGRPRVRKETRSRGSPYH